MQSAERLLAHLRDRLDPVDAPVTAPRFGDGDLNGAPALRETATTALRDAAVLAPLIIHDGPPRLLLTERAPHLARHAGQVAFPGGRVDPTGETPAEAAVRELEEEVGIGAGHVELLGRFERARYAPTEPSPTERGRLIADAARAARSLPVDAERGATP